MIIRISNQWKCVSNKSQVSAQLLNGSLSEPSLDHPFESHSLRSYPLLYSGLCFKAIYKPFHREWIPAPQACVGNTQSLFQLWLLQNPWQYHYYDLTAEEFWRIEYFISVNQLPILVKLCSKSTNIGILHRTILKFSIPLTSIQVLANLAVTLVVWLTVRINLISHNYINATWHWCVNDAMVGMVIFLLSPS